MRKPENVPLGPEQIDDLDRAILDYLQEGRDSGDPWGIATPAIVLEALKEGDYPEDDIPVRQTINNRMRRLQLAGHLEDPFDKGVYQFVSDPREVDEDE